MERLVELSQQVFGQDPQAAFRELVEPFLERHAAQRKNAEAVFPPQEVAELLEQFEQLLGSPRDDGLSDTPARLLAALSEAADKLVQQWGQKLAELPVRLIESPDFRLAGAEEVIRQMVASIEQALQHHEPLLSLFSGLLNQPEETRQSVDTSPVGRCRSGAPRRRPALDRYRAGATGSNPRRPDGHPDQHWWCNRHRRR
jgi:hypothetical protein